MSEMGTEMLRSPTRACVAGIGSQSGLNRCSTCQLQAAAATAAITTSAAIGPSPPRVPRSQIEPATSAAPAITPRCLTRSRGRDGAVAWTARPSTSNAIPSAAAAAAYARPASVPLPRANKTVPARSVIVVVPPGVPAHRARTASARKPATNRAVARPGSGKLRATPKTTATAIAQTASAGRMVWRVDWADQPRPRQPFPGGGSSGFR